MAPRAEPGSWGRWGADDERGALNLLQPDQVRLAAGLVRQGRVYSLALVLDRATLPVAPSRIPIAHYMSIDGGDFAAGVHLPHDMRVADDYIAMPSQSGTHLDALAHVWVGDELYNGHSANRVRSYGATRCGIDKIGGIVGRGVLYDVARLKGVEVLDGDYEITPADLEACLAAAGLESRPGDCALIRTGWIVTPRDRFHTHQPGIGLAAARWLAERDVALIGADNSAVERMVWDGRHSTPNVCHQLLIRDYGVHILELMDLEALAADRVAEFLFVVAPLPIKGGTGSPVNPLAIV